MKKVIFVCTGNTCRSPMAEVLFRQYIKQKGLERLCTVLSRGLQVGAAAPAAAFAQKAVQTFGADLSVHRSKALAQEDLQANPYFVCMTAFHAQVIQSVLPDAKVLVLNLSDPFGGSLEVYRACAQAINAKMPEIFHFVFAVDDIRKMCIEDIADAAKIETVCFSAPWTEQGLQAGLENETGLFFVAEEQGRTVGYIGANVILDEVYLNNLAVLPEYRKKGIAKSLLEVLISAVQAQNAAFVSLEVRMSNTPAIALYRQLGFTKRGQRRDFYSDPCEDALILTKDL